MNSRQIGRAVSGLLLSFLIGGCASHPKNSGAAPTLKPPPDQTPASTTRPDGMDAAAIDPVQVIAHRTAEYSRAMEPAIAQRPPVPTQPSQASTVQWIDPNELRLSSAAPHDPPVVLPPAHAAVESSPTAANEPATTVVAVAKPEPVMASASGPPTPVAKIVPQESSPDSSPESADAMSDKLARRVHDYPHDVSGQLDYQLLRFLLDQPVPNLTSMNALQQEDRELLAAVVDGLSNFRNNIRADSNMLLSRKVKPLLEMADRLRSQADLTIPTVALCTSVRGFGNYEPWPGDPPRFTAGIEHPVILYCEVQNFCSQLDQNKMWQTQLTQDAVLYTENGMAVWNDKTQSVSDISRNCRHDFFIVQRLKLPNTLVVGRYLLKVSVEDKQAKRVSEATLPLMVVAQ